MKRYVLTWVHTQSLQATVVAESMAEALRLIDDPEVQRDAVVTLDRDASASAEEADHG